MYNTRFSFTGDTIESGFETIEDAKNAIKEYEKDDVKNADFVPNYYEIYDVEKGETISI